MAADPSRHPCTLRVKEVPGHGMGTKSHFLGPVSLCARLQAHTWQFLSQALVPESMLASGSHREMGLLGCMPLPAHSRITAQLAQPDKWETC